MIRKRPRGARDGWTFLDFIFWAVILAVIIVVVAGLLTHQWT